MEAVNNPPINGSTDGTAAGTSKYGFNSATSGQSEAGSDAPVASPVSPPYWVQGHQRSVSNASVDSLPGGITLQDNTDEDDAKNKACWAKSVYIEDHVIVNGNRTGIGAFVVWNINVETLQGGTITIRKRYSEFDDLRYKLLQTFPNSEAAMPSLPRKSVISKFRPKFLENRRIGLQYFLK
ncbi:PX domain-containing protein [Lachnellula willkommii]|uniref:Endosomal/vacuolar adapter protein YPT35 n=1 Tax=Lachnellula willkommii TaxID=215461 RepID=A0A559M7L5_9HELO|nr:PX domain-containing protein [Lachnellula willkommii]